MILDKLKFNREFLTSVSYTIFEGLSKGGTHLLLLAVATLISKDLYLRLLLLVSAEALMTMALISYYTDVLFSFKKNRSDKFLPSVVDISIIQYILFIGLYFIFKKTIDDYYKYDLTYVFFLIIGNGFFTNIIKYYSVSYQLMLDHKQAIFYKSIPFFLSFVCCLVVFFLSDDKILGFFLGKFIGLLLFYIYILIKTKHHRLFFTSNKIYSHSFFQRAKYSFAIALVGWLAGLGFVNISNLFSQDKTQVLALALIFNISSVLQLFSNGINQVYVPKLKTIAKDSLTKAKKYSTKILSVFFLITLFFTIIFLIAILFNNFIIRYLPNLAILLTGKFYIMIIPFNFLLNSLQWVYAPYLIVLDEYKFYLTLKIILNVIFWAIIFYLLMIVNYSNFILFLVLLQAIDSIGIYFLVKKKLTSTY